jgi:hypothetical protein
LSRYLIAAFRPFNELLWRLFPEPISPLSRESWRCNSLALRLSHFRCRRGASKGTRPTLRQDSLWPFSSPVNIPDPPHPFRGHDDIRPREHRAEEAVKGDTSIAFSRPPSESRNALSFSISRSVSGPDLISPRRNRSREAMAEGIVIMSATV